MKQSILIALAAIFIITSCAKDSEQTNQPLPNQAADSRDNGDKVTICHLDDEGEYHTIEVSVNALPAHLAHGDYEGSCCPGNICFDAEDLDTDEPTGYYDSAVNDCQDWAETVFILSEDFAAVATSELFAPGVKVVGLFTPESGECLAVVGENLTEEEYECALDLLRASIAANPNAQNLCDGSKGSSGKVLGGKKSLLKKLPAGLLEKFKYK